MGRILAWRRFSAKLKRAVAAKGCAWLRRKLVLAIDQERGKSMKKILLSIVRGDLAAIGFVAVAPILVMAVTLALAPPALAQFTPDSPSVSDSEDPSPPAIADPPADVPIESAAPAAAASASASDHSAADHSGWDRASDEDNSGPPDKVLEVPQVVAPADGQPPAATGQAAPNGDSSSPDQVGSVDDYQDEDDGDLGGGGYVSAGALNSVRVGTVGGNPGPLNPALGSGYIPMNPSGANLARPGANGMNTAIGSTSPMLPSSHGLSPMPGRW
jgi:hypothetical protein